MKFKVNDIIRYKNAEWKVTGVDSTADGRYSLERLEDGLNLGQKAWRIEKSGTLVKAALKVKPTKHSDKVPWWKILFGNKS